MKHVPGGGEGERSLCPRGKASTRAASGSRLVILSLISLKRACIFRISSCLCGGRFSGIPGSTIPGIGGPGGGGSTPGAGWGCPTDAACPGSVPQRGLLLAVVSAMLLSSFDEAFPQRDLRLRGTDSASFPPSDDDGAACDCPCP
jgi:hypothetical protein